MIVVMRGSVLLVLAISACWTNQAPPRQTPIRIADPMEFAPRETGPLAVGGAEIHVFGAYETVAQRGFREHTRGDVTVRIHRTAPQILVLSAYEPARYRIETAPGAHLRAVIVNGYYAHKVSAPPGVRIIDLSGEGRYLAASGNPGTGSGLADGAAGLVASVEGYLGARVTSYHGCYRATSITQLENGEMTADCTDGYGGTMHEVALDRTRPELPDAIRAYVAFRASLLARCRTWHAAACSNEGGVIVIDRSVRDAGVTIDGVAVRSAMPIKHAPGSVTIVGSVTTSKVELRSGHIIRVTDQGAAPLGGRGQIAIMGDASVVTPLGGAIGGSMCGGTSCIFGRDHDGLFELLDFFASTELAGVHEVRVSP